MAVAGINNVSVLETSYLGENVSLGRPISRTSFIRKMWRDLECESRNSETERQQTNETANVNLESQCSWSSEGAESEDVSIVTSENENESPRDNGNVCLHRSPAITVADKERVTQVFREWGSKNSSGNSLNVSHKNNSSRAQWLCENECKRVRTVRQWIESNTQQAETGHSVIEEHALETDHSINRTRAGTRRSIRGRQALLDLLDRFEMEREKEKQSLLESRLVSTFAHRNRIQALLKGRFLWNQRFAQDEKSTSTTASELGLLRQTHSVSDLRKGFLSRVDSPEQTHDGPQSDTSSDNGIKYQENQLSDDIVNESETSSNDGKYQENQLLDDIVNESETSSNHGNYQEIHMLDDILNESETSFNDGKYQENQLLDDIVDEFETINMRSDTGETHCETETRGSPPPTEIIETRVHDQDQGTNHIEPSRQIEVNGTLDNVNLSETESNGDIEQEDNGSESNGDLDANSIENEDEWYQETVRSEEESHDRWYDNHPVVRTEAVYTSDDDTSNRLELRELVSRRRVSNLLQSDFRVRLDQLIQSYVERQDQASGSDDDWTLEREQQDPDQQSVDENDDVIGSVTESVHSLPPAIHQIPSTEWELINGLRVDMVRLQEQMNSMQSMLETCMNMQLQMQQSVQQEVSSALNRSCKSGDNNLQTCFLCCDFDSSPDRCGHVYVCSNCAEKINLSKLKESIRHP